jgi:PEGA domain-containing protein
MASIPAPRGAHLARPSAAGLNRSVVLLLAALLSAAPAGAPTLAPVAVGADAAGKTAAGQLQSLAAAAIARSSSFAPVDVVDALDADHAADRARNRTSAETALVEAEKAYNDLDTQRAARLADAAVRTFFQSDLSRVWPGYVRARVLKVACLAANGQSKPARAELERLVASAPDAELPPAQFPPDLLAFARRARAAANRAEARLEVKSSPAGAEVWVDGKRHGVTPLTVRGLGPGDHQLTLRLPGYVLFQQAASGSVSATLEPASRHSTWTALERSASDRATLTKAAGALASSAGAAQVLLVVASRGDRPGSLSLDVARVDAGGGRIRAAAKGAVPVEDLGAAASILLDRALGPDQAPQLVPSERPLLAETAPPALAVAPGQTFTWTQTHTGYSLMAGGAVLAGTGGFFGYQALVKRDQLRATAQTDPASQQLIVRGQLYAALADALFASALAAGAAGGYFAFLAPGQGAR